MRIFLAGGETSDHRKRLVEGGAEHVSLSFWNLRKKIKKATAWSIAENFPPGVEILVEAGASSMKADDYDADDWRAFGDQYAEFVETNIERITLVTEFDATMIGRDYIEELRGEYWNEIDPAKFLPVWHEAHGGLAELEAMAEEYEHVAIGAAALDDRKVITNRLNQIVQRYGMRLHGLGMTKPDQLRTVRFDSVSSTSWVSPMRFGDTIVWDGMRLRRYPAKYKEQARRRHRTLFEKHGFDAEKIAADDPSEVVRLSIWSWLQFEAELNRRKGLSAVGVDDEPEDSWEEPTEPQEPSGEHVVATSPDGSAATDAELALVGAATSPQPMRNASVELARAVEDLKPLPGFAFMERIKVDDQGEETGRVTVVRSSTQSLRQCDTCYVAATCPEATPGTACAYGLSVDLQTPEQMAAAMTTMIEVQFQRVAFGRFTEEMEGGQVNPDVSAEMDRWFKMVNFKKEIESESFRFKIEGEAKASSGVLSAIFGGQAKALRSGDEPERAQASYEGADVVDAEVLD